MPASTDILKQESRYWPVPLVRASAALIAGIVITFTAEHSLTVGLWVFGAFAIFSGIELAGLTVNRLRLSAISVPFIAQGLATALAGAAALTLVKQMPASNGLAAFAFLIIVWAAVTGCLELFSALRWRGKSGLAKDWLVTGALTAILALIYLLIPMGTVSAVGMFGAYAIVIGVYLMIGAFTLKWAPTAHQQTQTAESHR